MLNTLREGAQENREKNRIGKTPKNVAYTVCLMLFLRCGFRTNRQVKGRGNLPDCGIRGNRNQGTERLHEHVKRRGGGNDNAKSQEVARAKKYEPIPTAVGA